jgi:anaerobic selenocysteine-containing dehydrogenase
VLPEVSGQLPAVTLADEIMTPGPGQIRAMITQAGNPLLSNPNSARLTEAFAQLEFMMSIDIYLNETTRHADLILPTAGHSEHSHYTLYSSFYQVRHYARWSPPLFRVEDGRSMKSSPRWSRGSRGSRRKRFRNSICGQ